MTLGRIKAKWLAFSSLIYVASLEALIFSIKLVVVATAASIDELLAISGLNVIVVLWERRPAVSSRIGFAAKVRPKYHGTSPPIMIIIISIIIIILIKIIITIIITIIIVIIQAFSVQNPV